VQEHLVAFAQIHGKSASQSKQLALQCMARLGIEEYAGFRSKALSGGEVPSLLLAFSCLTDLLFVGTQRKLSLGLVLVNDPPVCMLDEVSTGLDPGLINGHHCATSC
jgi:ABC-type multidrug transport system ATPase subunit